MNKSLAWLLNEIDQKIDGRLPSESKKAILAEVQSHLDTGIRARVSNGVDPELAEVEAVKAFGPPQAYVNDLLDLHKIKGSKPKYWWGTTRADKPTIASFFASCIWCILYFPYSMRFGSTPLLQVVGIGCIGAFVVFSFRARRVQILPIAFATPLAFLSAGIVYSLMWLNVWHHGAESTTAIAAWEAKSVSRLEKVRIANIEQKLGDFQVGLAMHFDRMTPSEIDQLTPKSRSILVSALGSQRPESWPTLHPWGLFHGLVVSRLGAHPTDDAIRQWKFGAIQAISSLKQARQESQKEISAIDAAMKRYPLGDIVTNVSQLRNLVWFWFLIGVFLNVVAVGAARLVHSPLAQRIRRGVA